MKRCLYFFYYLLNMDTSRHYLYMKYVRSTTGKSYFKQMYETAYFSLKYNIALSEYYLFRFYNLPHSERDQWAGTGFMYEYQKKMNPHPHRILLKDKWRFYQEYNRFFKHRVYFVNQLENQSDLTKTALHTDTGKLVFKKKEGNCGKNIAVLPTDYFKNGTHLVTYMKDNAFDLAEEYVEQHSILHQLSPTAVNTVRIFTQINAGGEVDILGCVLRISVNGIVDNLAAGNAAAPIDLTTGRIVGPAVFSNITKPPVSEHPVTQISIMGLQVPFWNDCIALAENAAKWRPINKSVGWDIVVTPNGPGLIEGNHDWCKLVFQLPDNTGKKNILKNYL